VHTVCIYHLTATNFALGKGLSSNSLLSDQPSPEVCLCLSLQLGLSQRELELWPVLSTEVHPNCCLDCHCCLVEELLSQLLQILAELLTVRERLSYPELY